MLIYATNIHITPIPGALHWISHSDFNEWSDQLFRREEWHTQQHPYLPPGIVSQTKGGADFTLDSIDIDLPLPKGKINRELRMAIYAIRQWGDVDIKVEQKEIEKETYEMLHDVKLDKSFLVEVKAEQESD